MPVHEYKTGDVIMGSIPHGADLLDALTRICEERGVTVGLVSLIGSVSSAALAFYHQDIKTYENLAPVEIPMEIVSAMGNVSLKDGKPMVHLHMILSSSAGLCVAGHLIRGTKVFALEFSITKLSGPALERGMDNLTGLNLWKE
ncbi:MAG: DUF296 domain-containing protein [Nitrospinae bacterium]|nr:DUF296 domain-containing protein [Nitrospinota bacterium]